MHLCSNAQHATQHVIWPPMAVPLTLPGQEKTYFPTKNISESWVACSVPSKEATYLFPSIKHVQNTLQSFLQLQNDCSLNTIVALSMDVFPSIKIVETTSHHQFIDNSLRSQVILVILKCQGCRECLILNTITKELCWYHLWSKVKFHTPSRSQVVLK